MSRGNRVRPSVVAMSVAGAALATSALLWSGSADDTGRPDRAGVTVQRKGGAVATDEDAPGRADRVGGRSVARRERLDEPSGSHTVGDSGPRTTESSGASIPRPKATPKQASSPNHQVIELGAAIDADLSTREAANEQLRSPDVQDRLDGIWELSQVDPAAARTEAETLLRSDLEDESRWSVYDRLIDLAESDEARIDVAIRALGDADPEVRDQAAYWLSTEDGDRFPQILESLRGAYAAETNEDARASIESALESQDLDFVPPSVSEADLDDVDSTLVP